MTKLENEYLNKLLGHKDTFDHNLPIGSNGAFMSGTIDKREMEKQVIKDMILNNLDIYNEIVLEMRLDKIEKIRNRK